MPAKAWESALSHAETVAPSRNASVAAARPLRPTPRIATCFPARVMVQLGNLEQGEAEQGEHDGNDPEADDHLVFMPAEKLEMVVDRRHLEDPLFAELETAHLEDDGHRFHHEHAADDDEERLLLGADRGSSERAADGEGTGVAHEDLGRVAIGPEEAKTRAHQC